MLTDCRLYRAWSRRSARRPGPAWSPTFTQAGIGTVRTRPCLPTRSTIHQRPGPRRLLEPGQELVQRHAVHAARNRRGDAVEDQRLQLFPLRYLFYQHLIVHFWVLLLGINGSHSNTTYACPWAATLAEWWFTARFRLAMSDKFLQDASLCRTRKRAERALFTEFIAR